MTIAALPELLSPAGDWEALRAAVANGANAVYFGLPLFNARHRATNFSPDDLPRIVRFLHDRNVKGFITLNTLIFSEELPSLVEYLQLIARCGVDAVIVQDLGVARLIRKMVPTLHVHASTQMTLTEPRGIRFVQEQLGIERAVLARELSLDEIRKIAPHTTMPLEVFVHGALCVAYSGQCLTSEALGGRSANRGQCAQACRLPYEMLVDGQHHELGDRAYLLSPQDLAAHDLIDDLIQSGIISFKIEGRLKSSHYVAATTKTYRDAIDASTAKQEFHLGPREQRDLAQTFSRGFTPGFLEGNNHQKLVQGRFPKSRGVRVGTFAGIRGRSVLVDLVASDEPLIKPGDGVVFDLGHPEEQEPGGRVWEVKPLRGARVELVFENLDATSIPKGAIVWKTDDPALRKRLEQSYAADEIVHRLPLDAILSGKIGEPLTLKLSVASDEVELSWPGPLETARKQPLSPDSLVQQLDRLGDTPFSLGRVSLQLPETAMIPKSVVNGLRRRAVESLLTRRRDREVHAVANPNALDELRSEIAVEQPNDTDAFELTVLVRTLEQLDAALAWRSESGRTATRIYCDFEDIRRYREAVPRARDRQVPIALATHRILKPGEEGFLKPILNSEPDGVLIRNLGGLDFFRREAPHLRLYGDFSLNVANELTADLLMRQGLSTLVPSFDLNWEQLVSLVELAPASWFEPVIHQHMPMFHMEHCVFAAFLSTGKDFRDCGRPCDRHRVELKDRVGAEFPVLPDAGCRNTVFNSVPQSAADYLSRMLELRLRRFRIDLLRESASEVNALMTQYAGILSGQEQGRNVWRHFRALNQLGVTRGTLQLIGT